MTSLLTSLGSPSKTSNSDIEYELAPPDKGRKDPVIVDVVRLKKQWSKSNIPTYWVELIWNTPNNNWLVRKRWKFGKDNETIRGATIVCENKSPGTAMERYLRAIENKLQPGYEYVIESRWAVSSSPAWQISTYNGISMPVVVSVTTTEEDKQLTEEPAPPPMKRSGDRDWW